MCTVSSRVEMRGGRLTAGACAAQRRWCHCCSATTAREGCGIQEEGAQLLWKGRGMEPTLRTLPPPAAIPSWPVLGPSLPTPTTFLPPKLLWKKRIMLQITTSRATRLSRPLARMYSRRHCSLACGSLLIIFSSENKKKGGSHPCAAEQTMRVSWVDGFGAKLG